MIAAIGAACRTMKIGKLNHSMERDSPIAMPKPMPMTPARAMPMMSGWSVDR